MNAARLALHQVRFENKTFWRNPASAFFTFAFPLMFLVIFNGVFGDREVVLFGRTTTTSNFYVPSIAAFSVITACFTGMAMNIVFAREQGVLKRKLGTPLPPSSYIGGRILHATAIELLLVTIVVLAGRLFYGVPFPTASLPAFIVTLLVGSVAFCSLGIAVTALVPNAHAAPAVVNAIILPLLFVSDVFFGPDASPGWLRSFANLFPIRHYLEAMLRSFFPLNAGSGWAWGELGVVLLWGAAGIALAVKFFRWEPRER
ncbi:MAG: ABC transporter permease [Actinomycetota bacterium]